MPKERPSKSAQRERASPLSQRPERTKPSQRQDPDEIYLQQAENERKYEAIQAELQRQRAESEEAKRQAAELRRQLDERDDVSNFTPTPHPAATQDDIENPTRTYADAAAAEPPQDEDDAARASPEPQRPQAQQPQPAEGEEKKMNITASLRAALKANGLLSIVGGAQATTIGIGTPATLAAGHEDVRSYNTYAPFEDIAATLEGVGLALRMGILKARQAVVVVRRACGGLHTLVLLRGVPSAHTTSKISGWTARVKLIELTPPHASGAGADIDIPLDPVFKIVGAKAVVAKFAKDHKLRFAKEYNFSTGGSVQTHAFLDMPVPLAAKAKLSYGLLVLPLDALVSSRRASHMLSVDFNKQVGPAECVAILHAICARYGAFATIANFRGRLLFSAIPEPHMVDHIMATAGVRTVRAPFVVTHAAAPAGEDDDSAAITHLPESSARGPALLVESDGFLPPKWVEKIVAHMVATMPGQRATIATMDGRTAVVACSAAVLEAFAGKTVGGRIRLFDYATVATAAKEARRLLEESVARAADANIHSVNVPQVWTGKQTPIAWIAVCGARRQKSTAIVYTIKDERNLNITRVFKDKAIGSVVERLQAAIRTIQSAAPATEILSHHSEFLSLLSENQPLRWVHRCYNLYAIEEAHAHDEEREPMFTHMLLHPAFGCDSRAILPTPLLAVTPNDLFKAAIQARRNVWRALPSHLTGLWREALTSLVTADETAEDTRCALLLVAPCILLDKTLSPTISQLHTNLLRVVASPHLRNEAITTFLMKCPDDQQQVSPLAPTPSDVARKTKMLISIGAERKALDIASRAESVCDISDDARIAEINRLFPSRKRDIPDDPPVLETLCETKAAADFRHVTFRLARGAAPGIDGWTRELLLPILDRESIASDTLCAVLNNMLLGALPPNIVTFINTSRLIPLLKPNKKIRPIVLSSVFLKIAWKTLLLGISQASVLHPSQVLGRRPCERAIHQAQRRLAAGEMLLFLDAKNAFGEVQRAAIHTKLVKHPELHSLIPMFNMCYRTPSSLLAQGHVFRMEEGVRQGCAAAPFLFHLALSLALESLPSTLKNAVSCVADDIVIAAPSPLRVREAHDILIPALASIGIHLNASKCVSLRPPDMQDQPSPFLEEGYTDASKVDYLGAFIAHRGIQASWGDLREKYKQKLDVVQQLVTSSSDPHSPLTKQDCFLMIRYTCFCFSYVLSNSNPANTQLVRQQLNSWLRSVMDRIVGCVLTDAQWQQCTLAAKDGGLDLVDWSGSMAEKAHNLTKTLASQHQAAVHDPSIKTASVFDLIRTIQSARADELQNTTPHYTRALRNMHVDGDHRLRWHAIRPNSIELRLTNQQWLTGMRLQLGIPVVQTAAPAACGFDNATDHALCCPSCAAGFWKTRHQRVLFALQKGLRAGGVHLSTSDYTTAKGLKRDEGPDGLVFGNSSTAAIDVTIVHQPTGERRARAAERYAHKAKKYDKICKDNNWSNAPLVFHSVGHPSLPTTRWLRTFASFCRVAGTFRRILHACSIAVIRGNADIISILSAVSPTTST